MTGLQSLLGGLDLAAEQVAVELHLGGVAERRARTALAATAHRQRQGSGPAAAHKPAARALSSTT
jgi:hypothetical protein